MVRARAPTSMIEPGVMVRVPLTMQGLAVGRQRSSAVVARTGAAASRAASRVAGRMRGSRRAS
jgi:hypothetical protein